MSSRDPGASPEPLAQVLLKGRRPYVWLTALILILYTHCLRYGLIHLDDDIFLNGHFSFLADWRHFPELFRKGAFLRTTDHFYRPLLVSTFMVDACLWGQSPELWHVLNIVFHAASSALVFRILSHFCRRSTALLLAAVFAVHPALASASAWICGRTDAFFALWALGAFHCFQLFLERGKGRWVLAHLALLAGAYLSKELAVVVSVACLAYARLVDVRLPSPAWRRLLLIGWVAELGAWGLTRRLVLHPTHGYSAAGVLNSFLSQTPALLIYWGKAFLPFGLSPYPTLPDASMVFGIVAALAVVVALARSEQVNKNTVLWGLIWFFLFLAPSLVYPDSHPQPVHHEYRLYLPLAGALVLLSQVGFFKKFDLNQKGQAQTALLLLAALAFLSWSNTSIYSDDLTAWSRAVEASPNSAMAHDQLGLSLVLRHDYARAESEFQKTLQLDPDIPGVHNNLGAVYMQTDLLVAARSEFLRELKANPDDQSALRNLSMVGESSKSFLKPDHHERP